MVETLDVNGSSILKTHRDPRPPAPEVPPPPPDGFRVRKPPGADVGGAGDGGKVPRDRDKGLSSNLLRIKTYSQLQKPNKDTHFRDKKISVISEQNVTTRTF